MDIYSEIKKDKRKGDEEGEEGHLGRLVGEKTKRIQTGRCCFKESFILGLISGIEIWIRSARNRRIRRLCSEDREQC